jgi:hypothetical protein
MGRPFSPPGGPLFRRENDHIKMAMSCLQATPPPPPRIENTIIIHPFFRDDRDKPANARHCTTGCSPHDPGNDIHAVFDFSKRHFSHDNVH